MAQYRHAYPSYRVFIFGVEVSDDVVSVRASTSDGAAPNQCQITLLNELDKYVITTQDLMGLNGIHKLDIPWMPNAGRQTSEHGSHTGFDISVDNDNATLNGFRSMINSRIIQERKKKVLDRKIAVIQSAATRTGANQDFEGRSLIDAKYTNYFGSTIRKYPLSDGSPIFHAMDSVRVFMRDPFNPTKWYWHFSGFVSDLVESSDKDNAKQLIIGVEDPTKLFRYTRLAINPGVLDANKVITNEDLRTISFRSHFMHDFTLPEVFYTMVFGPDRVGLDTEKMLEQREGAEGQSTISTKLRGIGHFSFDTSVIATFGPPPDARQEGEAEKAIGGTTTPDRDKQSLRTTLDMAKLKIELGDNLAAWQAMIDHEVRPSDLYMMANEYDRVFNPDKVLARAGGLRTYTDGQIVIDDVIKYIGEHPEEYMVDGGRLMMLVPNSLGAYNNDILMKDIIQSYPLQSEFISAGKILYDLVERIQFVMYCTPKGDLIVEPPLYDFDPDDFGMQAVPQNKTSEVDTIKYEPLAFAEGKLSGGPIGPFGPRYVLSKNDVYNYESAIIDERIYTMAVAKHSLFYNWDNQPYSDIIGDLTVVRLLDLVPLYGVRQAPLAPRGYINTHKGVELYAHIALNKLNADAHTISISHVPNLQLWPNRPIYIEAKNAIATTKSISHSIVWGAQGSMSTNSELYCMRVWSGQIDKDNRPIFTTIGGYGSRPLNYAILFKRRSPPSEDN